MSPTGVDPTAVELDGPDFEHALCSDSDVQVDMSPVYHLSASGLHLIVAAASRLARQGRKLRLVGCSEDIADLIELVVPASVVEVVEAAPADRCRSDVAALFPTGPAASQNRIRAAV